MSQPTISFCLRNVHVLNERGEFGPPLDVLVQNGYVHSVGESVAAGDAPSHDFSGLFLMPGLVDCHLHITGNSETPEPGGTPVALWTLRAAAAARKTLDAGVTFARDLGGAEAGLQRGIETRLIEGPDLRIAISMLSKTGGHGDGYLLGEDRERPSYSMGDYLGRPPHLVDGPDEMRRAVRVLARARANWIKLCSTGGIASEYDDPEAPELTFDEIAVAVEEASRHGLRVAAHAYGGSGLSDAIAAGVASIEHGTFLTEEQAREMARRGTWLVPTITVLKDDVARARAGGVSDAFAGKALRVGRALGEAVEIARAAGVSIAMGSDACIPRHHGANAAEVTALCEAGVPAPEALLAATSGGAQLCGKAADEIGQVAPGKRFDAIILDVDPSNTRAFSDPTSVTGVFKNGRAVLPHPRLG